MKICAKKKTEKHKNCKMRKKILSSCMISNDFSFFGDNKHAIELANHKSWISFPIYSSIVTHEKEEKFWN